MKSHAQMTFVVASLLLTWSLFFDEECLAQVEIQPLPTEATESRGEPRRTMTPVSPPLHRFARFRQEFVLVGQRQ